MFYSHEILTSRRHGVATIWLVATLGSKSTLKKVSRRAILDVDVAKACETIANPESPMALRLQSSLLFGVSRVFSQQCGYILTDSQSLHDKMRGVGMVMRDLQIDTNLASTSNEQLNLPIDPSFDFDLDMGLDLSVFNISSSATERSSILSPHTHRSSQSSLLPEDDLNIPELALPSRDISGDEFFDFDMGAAGPTSSINKSKKYASTDLDEPGIDLDPSFIINDDDMIIDRPTGQAGLKGVVTPDPFGVLDDNVAVKANNANESRAVHATQEDTAIGFEDDDNVVMGDDADPLPLSPVRLPALATPDNMAVPGQNAETSPPEVFAPGREETETTAEAPQRRRRPARVLQTDQITELSNRQLTEWEREYMETMERARDDKAMTRSIAQAKRNAAYWILDQGIGGVSVNFGDDREMHPLTIFSGQTLIEALTGERSFLVGRKRSLSEILDDDEEDDEEHMRRNRSGSERDVGRSAAPTDPAADEAGMLFHGDDDIEVQVGRQPASSLKDQPSSMPWNLIASSRHGSSRGSAQPGISSSFQGIRFDVGPASRMSGRASRLTSASPLFGRGRPLSRLGSLDPQNDDPSISLDTADFADPFMDMAGDMDEDFELYGPAAVVSTQQAAQSQWLAATLENEAQNFLMFLNEQIANAGSDDQAESTITFDRLLPPEQNSYVVAAQGILHVLALATKGLIHVQQDEAFGEITLSSVVTKAVEEEETGDIVDDVAEDEE